MSNPPSIPTPARSRLPSAIIALGILAVGAVLVSTISQASADLSLDQLVTFYFFPAVLLLALTLVLRAPRTVRVNVALLLVASSGAALAGETLLTVVLHLQATRDWDRQVASRDTRSTTDIALDLRAEGERAYPALPGALLVELEPLLGSGSTEARPLAPTPAGAVAVLCNESGAPVTYMADRFGFNNPDSAWDAESVDVILIGDSYTHGSCVPSPDQIATHLRDDWSVLNLGVRGAGPLYQLAITREYATSRTPQVLLWIYFEGNDLWDLRTELERPWLSSYLEEGHTQDLIGRQRSIDPLYATWIDSLLSSPIHRERTRRNQVSLRERLTGVIRLRALRRQIGFGVLRPSRRPSLGALPEVLDHAREQVVDWGGALVLVYMPAYERYATRVGEGIAGRSDFRRYVEGRGIPLIDVDSVFAVRSNDPKAMWAVPGGHLSPEGYGIVADAIRATVSELIAATPRGISDPTRSAERESGES